MTLLRYLANLGYGSRREVAALLDAGRVTTSDGATVDASSRWTHDQLRVDGEPLDPPPGMVVMLHKPVGYVCSTRDVNPLVYDLLPARFARRSPLVAAVGRLDRDTSGLLLLTDDGALNHRLTSPRRHVPKRYVAELADDLTGDEAARFACGTLRLDGEAPPLRPAALERLAPRCAQVTITEGRYHQVRRMFAAVGHHVTALHRVAVGPVELGDLPAGAWRLLSDDERRGLDVSPVASPPAP
jgi:16S rRNA pseudouridine516 synthase